ncbi:cell division cycle 20.5, cofactor of APC complex-like [Bidens hawaiensis]|uniref:cell division cycle 20.5, cofactor of APC complex-like n=1 Tax=Bidens hawaiensis TaxID=980011 RepID=UPI004049D461
MKLELNPQTLTHWKPQSDWYSPTRFHHTPVEYDFPGDRFIPNRSLMDLDQACTLLTSRTNYPPKSNFSKEYRRIMEGNLTLDSEGRPFRLLVFRGSPKSSRKSIKYVDEIRRDDEENFQNKHHINQQRKLPKKETKMLDAPLIRDDFYMNVMDWGKNNILAIALGQELYLWNPVNQAVDCLLSTEGSNDRPSSISWSHDGKTLAVGLSQSQIQLFDSQTSTLINRLEGHHAMVGATSWNGHILTSGSSQAILNHDVRVGNSLVSCLKAHRNQVCGLKWSITGNLLASGGDDSVVYIWEASRMNSARFVHRFTNHVAAVKALAWCPYNFQVLASGGGTNDGCIKLWDTQQGTCINSINTEAQICALEWNRHYKEIVSAHGYSIHNASKNNNLSLWKYPSMVKVGDLTSHSARVLQLAQNLDGLTLVSAGADETLRLWEIWATATVE